MMKLAVLIDADNISPSQADDIFKIVDSLGEPITKRAFGNITVFSGGKEGWKDEIRKRAIEARPQVSNIDRKNTADFALIIDAMDLLFQEQYEGYVIVSSDSDFTSLAQRIRNSGKSVYGIGDNRAPASFREACTQFKLLDKAEPQPVAAPQDPPKDTKSAIQTQKLPRAIVIVDSSTAKASDDAATSQIAQPKAAKPAQKQQTPIPSKGPSMQEVMEKVKKQKPKKLSTLRKLLTDQHSRTEAEAEAIIKHLKNEKNIKIDKDKITWNC